MINKIIILLKSIYSHIFFFFINIFLSSKYSCCNNSKYIISITTYHKRLKTLHLVLESLLRQKSPPNKILLWISTEDIKACGRIPTKIEKLKSKGVVVLILNENNKSYKKLSYIYSYASEYLKHSITHIITADDDIFYPFTWAKGLLDKSISDKAVSCYRGHDLVMINNEYDYNISMKKNISKNSASNFLLPTGCSGICYPIASLSMEIENSYQYLKLAPNADDIWYKAVTLSNGFKSTRVLPENIHFPVVLSSLKDGLYHNNVLKHENNNKIKNTFNYFNINHYFYDSN